ncbi:MAG: hypothetical protein Q8O83_01085 [bacterium]|nr:hypothetical protein [bacterium]
MEIQPDHKLQCTQTAVACNMYTNLRLNAFLIPPHPYLESLIYPTNDFMGHPDPQRKEIILSNMLLDTRFHEPEEIAKWFPLPGYTIHKIPRIIRTSSGETIEMTFEGFGDMLPGRDWWFAGIGQRTTKEAVQYVARHFGLEEGKIAYLRLVNPYFYHLDTCLLSLRYTNHLIYYPGAFDEHTLQFLRTLVCERYEVSEHLAKDYLICNSAPLGNIVVLNAPFEGISEKSMIRTAQGILLSKEDRRFREIEERSSEYADFIRYLWSLGYNTIPAYTSEVRKDGAGIFCLSNFVHL